MATLGAFVRAFGNGVKVGGRYESRFMLFHWGLSVCSEKVRTVLSELDIGYSSQLVNILVGRQYDPKYVELRLMAWRDMGCPPLVGDWRGGTSVRMNGFDPCVVPTLVDLEKNKVVVNSLDICKYLFDLQEKTWSSELIEKHLRFVDETPHKAFLFEPPADSVDNRPLGIRKGTADGKALQSYCDEVKRRLAERGTTWDDDDLERAYKAKLKSNEAGVQNSKKKDPNYYRDALLTVRNHLETLETDLNLTEGPYLTGPEISIADLFHAVNFHRFYWVGQGPTIFDNTEPLLPRVRAYKDKLLRLKSLQDAVIFHPSMPPSEAMAPIKAILTAEQQLKTAESACCRIH